MSCVLDRGKQLLTGQSRGPTMSKHRFHIDQIVSCTGCGMIGADARPNWRKQHGPGQITRGLRCGHVGIAG
jgi:hypothetical protein